jgi:hypothetical protein
MIPTNARKKFRFNMAPSDRQLWAIGAVVVQWTAIEQFVKVFAHSFTDEEDPDDEVRKHFDNTRSMQMRLDQLEDLSKTKLNPPWIPKMLTLLNEIRQVQDMRDKIVHGTWGDKNEAPKAGSDTHGTFSLGRPGHPFDWRLDYGGIVQVALRIDALQAAMFDFAIQANGTTSEQFTFGSALRKIQLK